MAYTSFADLLEATGEHGTLAAAAMQREAVESGYEPQVLRARMHDALAVMRTAVEEGRAATRRSRSGLTGGDASRVSSAPPGPLGSVFSDVLASSLAVAEVNASMGRIVAAPTGGASGVLPGVLLTLAEDIDADDEMLVDALFTAGAVGGVIAARASLAGASGGCQAEIGSAAAMAAAAGVEMLGGPPEASGHGGSLALQGLLGLVCDPVGGLVEVPCVARNATGAAVALAGIELALAGVTFPIPFDEVVDASGSVGRSLPPSLRETAVGGLAGTPTAHRIIHTPRPGREA
ncbi:MAG: L-serine ammonia-lyase, iron-sulfur-dependent, subunit alpha [Coriobacteriia bacterium]|jgi:L-serine dehydratase|nr:L-serine ammonia-lyase, iron-sulfur-dependent, subunit alpha [Coriobacteriia bacterium]